MPMVSVDSHESGKLEGVRLAILGSDVDEVIGDRGMAAGMLLRLAWRLDPEAKRVGTSQLQLDGGLLKRAWTSRCQSAEAVECHADGADAHERVASLMMQMARMNAGDTDEQLKELAGLVGGNVSEFLALLAEDLDVLARLLQSMGADGVAIVSASLSDESDCDIMAHMAARLAIAGAPDALQLLRAAAGRSEETVGDIASGWLAARFDRRPPSPRFRRPPECHDPRYAGLRLWYKQGTPVEQWIRCPKCGEKITERELHAVQCGECDTAYADSSYAPVFEDSVLTGFAAWEPTTLFDAWYWGVAKPWTPGADGHSAAVDVDLLTEGRSLAPWSVQNPPD